MRFPAFAGNDGDWIANLRINEHLRTDTCNLRLLVGVVHSVENSI